MAASLNEGRGPGTFQQDETGRRLEDVLAIGDPDMYSAGNPVQATTTTLKELQVFPQPLQKPHPRGDAGLGAGRHFAATGTAMPGIFTFTAPRWLRLVM
jgi:hypothetical protein